MWNLLPDQSVDTYKQLILGFASLSELFAQKSSDGEVLKPIINSKFQETAFQKAFNAIVEDIGNTSYDASLVIPLGSKNIKCLVGIKTFGFTSGYQKIAQFKRDSAQWTEVFASIENNTDPQQANQSCLDLIKEIATLRNERIRSSIANLRGFQIDPDDIVDSVYHVLMPGVEGGKPQIHVGECSYDEINIDNLKVTRHSATSINFTDGKHQYRYTRADSQLLMSFDNQAIVKTTWDVNYLNDVFDRFIEFTESTSLHAKPVITESHSWKLDVQPLSGFNSHYSLGFYRIAPSERPKTLGRLMQYAEEDCPELKELTAEIIELCETKNPDLKVRDRLFKRLRGYTPSERYMKLIKRILYRPANELYLKIPNSRQFHLTYPDFFKKGMGEVLFVPGTAKLAISDNERSFDLVFEPSENKIRSIITQDGGKGIESESSQSILGEWILRGLFQLEPYQQLTQQRLEDIGINGIRMYRKKDDENVYVKFIWIDEDNLPQDYWS